MQQDFEAQAEDLGLVSGGDASRPRRMSQMVGIALAGTHSLVEMDRKTKAAAVGQSDREVIAETIKKFEGLHPDELMVEWKRYATNPYVAVGESMMGTVHEDGVEEFMNRKAFQDTLKAFPPFKPRKLEVSNIEIMFIGDLRAAATYRVSEEFQNGERKVDNCAAILMRLETGWRIAAVTTKDKGEAR
jgi:hypothetical protein